MEVFIFPLFGITVLLVLLVLGQRKRTRIEYAKSRAEREAARLEKITTMQCPQCAESIKIEAIRCRYCGHDDLEAVRRKTTEQLSYEPETVSEAWWVDQQDAFRRLNKRRRDAWIAAGKPDLRGWNYNEEKFEHWLARNPRTED